MELWARTRMESDGYPLLLVLDSRKQRRHGVKDHAFAMRHQVEPAVAVIAMAVAMAVSKTPANAHRPMLTGHRAPT